MPYSPADFAKTLIASSDFVGVSRFPDIRCLLKYETGPVCDRFNPLGGLPTLVFPIRCAHACPAKVNKPLWRETHAYDETGLGREFCPPDRQRLGLRDYRQEADRGSPPAPRHLWS